MHARKQIVSQLHILATGYFVLGFPLPSIV